MPLTHAPRRDAKEFGIVEQMAMESGQNVIFRVGGSKGQKSDA